MLKWKEEIRMRPLLLFIALLHCERDKVYIELPQCVQAFYDNKNQEKGKEQPVVILAWWCSHLRLDKAFSCSQPAVAQGLWRNFGLLLSWLFCHITGKIQLRLALSFEKPIPETGLPMHFTLLCGFRLLKI